MLITGPIHAGVELEMAERRSAAMRELALLPCVWWRHETGVQMRALVTLVHAPELVDLLVIPDAYTSIGGRAGEPMPMREVARGAGHYQWSRDLDPIPEAR